MNFAIEIFSHSLLPLHMETPRQSANFHESVWGDFFINCSPQQSKTSLTHQKQEYEKLQVEIRKILQDTVDPLQSLELIDSIERFGVAYHFEKEINDILCRVHKMDIGGDDDDLYATALHFRLLRQKKYQISSDVFTKFLDDKGEFKACLCNDVRALLSLYEASYLGSPDEDIFDKVKNFSRFHLKSSIDNTEPSIALMVSSALDMPLVRNIDRLKARSFLEIYENYNLCNKKLINFAKLDFNLLQTIHQEEVRITTIWWKVLNLSKYLPFARDRLVESYFWMLSAFSEPWYSHARVISTKITTLIVATDDIYDIYGTLEELELFTDIIECWDLQKVSILPEYMQRCFLALHNTLKEIEDELAPQHNSFRVHYLKEEFKNIARAYLQEAKWASEGHVPTLEEHLRVSTVTSGYLLITYVVYLGMEEAILKDTYEWLSSFPQIMKSLCIFGRLMNDIGSYQNEQKRNHVASSIQCYAKENSCSEMEAYEKLREMVEENWKIINREFVSSSIPTSLIRPTINIVCFSYFAYKDKTDIYTNSSEFMKKSIAKVLAEPILIHKMN